MLTLIRSTVPSASTSMTKADAAEWSRLWRSPLATAWDVETDGDSIRRLVEYRAERERLWATCRKEPIALGSMGQKTAHPLFDEVHRLEREIQRLEGVLGLQPKARMAMGLTRAGGEGTEAGEREPA